MQKQLQLPLSRGQISQDGIKFPELYSKVLDELLILPSDHPRYKSLLSATRDYLRNGRKYAELVKLAENHSLLEVPQETAKEDPRSEN